jgi:hypothetical protein
VWTEKGATVQDGIDAITYAETKCGTPESPERPASPVFYLGFINDVFQAKAAGNKLTTGGSHGAGSSTNTGFAQGETHASGGSSSKPSLAERATNARKEFERSAAAKRYEHGEIVGEDGSLVRA